MEGVPYLGAGAIYPVPLQDLVVEPFPIPDFWPRLYALDVGWNRTAALWLAHNRESDIAYAYSEHYVGQAEPLIHADAIKGSGKGNERAIWIPGVIDPAANGRSQADGQQLFDTYVNLGLKLTFAQNAVESGIYDTWTRMSTGKLKYFRHLGKLQWEHNLYRRDDKGKVVRKNNHLMDCLRYGLEGLSLARAVPVLAQNVFNESFAHSGQGWMAG